MTPKYSNLVYGMILGSLYRWYDFGVKRSKIKVRVKRSNGRRESCTLSSAQPLVVSILVLRSGVQHVHLREFLVCKQRGRKVINADVISG